jgi:hypothetical protein
LVFPRPGADYVAPGKKRKEREIQRREIIEKRKRNTERDRKRKIEKDRDRYQ